MGPKENTVVSLLEDIDDNHNNSYGTFESDDEMLSRRSSIKDAISQCKGQSMQQGEIPAAMWSQYCASFAAILTVPLAVIMPLSSNLTSAIVLLSLVTFFFSIPQALPPVVLQTISPNKMRAQTIAIFMFFSNILSYAFGATIIALITDLFGYEEALKYSMAITSGLMIPIGCYFIYKTLDPLRNLEY